MLLIAGFAEMSKETFLRFFAMVLGAPISALFAGYALGKFFIAGKSFLLSTLKHSLFYSGLLTNTFSLIRLGAAYEWRLKAFGLAVLDIDPISVLTVLLFSFAMIFVTLLIYHLYSAKTSAAAEQLTPPDSARGSSGTPLARE